jgi:phosphoglucomutase
MSNDLEFQYNLSNGGPSYFAMDDAFCNRMRAAIEAGLESAPIGVVTTPGTKNPKYVRTESSGPLASSWAI